MNSSDICHEVSGCPNLYVDAFRGQYLRKHTKNPDATFVLSHYHGDHYTQLPRDYKYEGPAKIHCTPITARLLIDVHLVSKDLVVEHEYGSTFRHRITLNPEDKLDKTEDYSDDFAKITFYDANHCPGACIILIELPDGKTTHLHTGDMRYHPRFQSYPLLSKCTKQRKLDLVYLDTTYCHPKHDFQSQDNAVDTIASQTQQLLHGNSKQLGTKNTLVLLSCYSIGKEKVLYEASKRSEQLIYVNEKKWKMLKCIQEDKLKLKEKLAGQKQSNVEKTSPLSHQQHMNIMERCTRDPSTSDLHVIPMGLAGEMWPYFQPNFQKLAKYVEGLSSLELQDNKPRNSNVGTTKMRKEYNKVVAFIPTGWADASNWNKKNAISTKVVGSLHVEVRLISYSEHSTFPELVSFVQYLKPRKIIPTVYSDESHKRKIEGRFRNMLDSTRAKQAFFRSMTKEKSTTVPLTTITRYEKDLSTSVADKRALKSNIASKNLDQHVRVIQENDTKITDDNEEIQVLRVVQGENSMGQSNPAISRSRNEGSDEDVNTIVCMGFDRIRAETALEKCNGNIQHAIDELLSSKIPTSTGAIHTKNHDQGAVHSSQLPHATAGSGKKRKISDFFAQRKN